MIDKLIQFDKDLFLWLNSFHNDFFDQLMFVISGKYTWIPLYLLVLFFIIRDKKGKFWIYVLALIVLVALTDLVSVHLFKNTFQRLRPCHDPGLEGMVHIVKAKCGGKFGFVSSHASNAFGFFVLSSWILSKSKNWITPVLFLWAALVAYSRVYLGVHFPADIIGGAILGSILAAMIAIILEKIPYSRSLET
jgi:undecaprenyl-diphosphatase